MDTSSCNICGARVTPQDLDKGRAIILLKKVWCPKCQVKMLEADRLRRAAKEKDRPAPSGHLTTTVHQPPAAPAI